MTNRLFEHKKHIFGLFIFYFETFLENILFTYFTMINCQKMK